VFDSGDCYTAVVEEDLEANWGGGDVGHILMTSKEALN
jgi:hypothetical protein